MASLLLDTDQVINISRVIRPNLNRYLQKKWVVPTIRGGGRGRANQFSPVDVAWIIVLREIFNLLPRSEAEVYLFQEGWPDEDARQWKTLRLKDGEQIQAYVRERAWEDEEELHYPIIVDLTCGRLFGGNKRWAELSLRPFDRAQRLFSNWFQSPYALTTSGRVVEQDRVIMSVSAIHLAQILKWVVHEVRHTTI